jgi:transcription initiation factor TFIIIB Brf1 subunit/transcription initiation factor TFIIB
MAMVCPRCYRTEPYNDDAGGATLCTHCGFVLTQDKVVSTVEFQENAGGTR